MADGILLKHGAGVDNTDLTAVSGDVLEGEQFLGADSKEAQMGAMKRITAVDKSMTVNETYNIPAGYHDGTDSPVEDGPQIDPGSGGITVNVKGKYLQSNAVLMSVENLRPEVIKYGVQIGDITGNYQGFPDEEG
jgi:hypothetical protein